MTCLTGGRNWLRFLEWMTMRNWHVRCGPLSHSHCRSVNGTMLRITIRPHWHCCASIRRVSCSCLSLSLPAETSGNCSGRRWWPMPKPSSFGQKIQSAYSGPTMPLGRECSGAQGGDEMLHLLLWWGCFQWHGSPRGTLEHPIKGSCAWEVPTNTDWLLNQGSCSEGHQRFN